MSSVNTNGVVVNPTATTSTPECEHPEHLALATAWYSSNPDIGNDPDLLGYAADAIGQFAEHEGRMPRCAAEVDAWSNSTDDYAEYLKANPAPEEQAGPVPAATQAAADAVAKAEQAQAKTEEEEAAARKAAHAMLLDAVKAFRKGERSYRDGLLEAGRLCMVYVGKRLALGDKRAAAVQAIEGQLAAFASDAVDVNRLIRCYAAFHLLAEEQELDTQAKNVAYGIYRDAWALLVERVSGEQGEEYRLLPGVEQLCRDHFKRSTAEGLSKAACVDWAKVCQREALVVVARQKAAAEEQAKAVRIKADQEAAEARKATQEAARLKEAAQKAAEEANAEHQEAEEEVAAAAKTGDAEALAAAKAEQERLAQEAKAKQDAAVKATCEADAKAAEHEKARLEAELTAKQEARAKEDAKNAAAKQAEAEAKRAALERKAAEREANKGARKAKPPGTNLVPAAKDASPKDVASWIAQSMLQNSSPDAVFVELLALLVNTQTEAPVAGFTVDRVQDAIMAAVWSLQEAAEQDEQPSDAALADLEAAEQDEQPSDAALADLEAAGVA